MSETTTPPPATSAALGWSDRPTVHDGDPSAQRWGPSQWVGTVRGGRAVLTCSYCGSLHPQVVLDVLGDVEAMRPPWMRDGDGAGPVPDDAWQSWIGLDLADMTYGWPHKLYLQGPGVGGLKFYTVHAIDEADSAGAGAAIRGLLARHGRVEIAREPGHAIRWRLLGW